MSDDAQRTMYGWEHCSHEGIGNVGCPTCDPNRHHVAGRLQWLLEQERAAHAKTREDLALSRAEVEARGKDMTEECAAHQRTREERDKAVRAELAKVRASLSERTRECAEQIRQKYEQAGEAESLKARAEALAKAPEEANEKVSRSHDTDPVEPPDTRRSLLFDAVKVMRAALRAYRERGGK